MKQKTASATTETQPYRPSVPPVRRTEARPMNATKKQSKKSSGSASSDDGGVVEILERIQDNLSTLAGEHRQRVVEFKVSVAEGLRQALGVMEVQSDRLTELLKSNQGLTRTPSYAGCSAIRPGSRCIRGCCCPRAASSPSSSSAWH